ncbi:MULTISPECIES: YjjI family glycine radical enzyme [unclassified Romboutsia]|uniref:YjjI family glycine radical enzyme n=1 Tax=unclassified Romboutsia TaxID=2626894 RepID=UPI000820943E|nr:MULTISPECIES: YjjI family glycine radical enzyme [unclassified Romboutsia]SCH89093.1 glycine radical enzyme%2C YjjI family [uncultured Clostridium sp.]
MEQVLNIIKNETLTYNQQVLQLAGQAESTLNVLNIDEETKPLLDAEIICTMFEGNAPYRPRYVIPNYEVLMEKGCEFLDLKPPTDIWEATNSLLILYKHVPSITSYPVYLGNIDTLLEPFVKDEEEAYKAIKLYLTHIDRALTDSFVHANIGPVDTKAGRLILKAMKELECAMPNLTVKYDKDITSKEFIELCASTALVTAKPSFANHKMDTKDFGTENYAIASCYNGFIIGGGGYTLVRLVLSRLAQTAESIEDFLDNKLPFAAEKMLEYIDERVRFLVEESAFFKSNFLVKEGFVNKDLFTGMFGMVGLAEAVNYLLNAREQKDRFGHSKIANDLGERIIEKLNSIVTSYKSKYVGCFNGNHVMHCQVGIDSDTGISPGCRIPVGEEPEIFEHIVQSAPYHKYFFNGIGDIFVFEDTYKDNPEAIVNIVDGAFNNGIRYISAYSGGCDVVRVTGYLVKKSEVAELESGKAVKNNATVFGMNAKNGAKAFDRRLRD